MSIGGGGAGQPPLPSCVMSQSRQQPASSRHRRREWVELAPSQARDRGSGVGQAQHSAPGKQPPGLRTLA